MNNRSDLYLASTVFWDEGPLTHLPPALDACAAARNAEQPEVDILPRAKPLDSKRLRSLLSQARGSATRELACEIYRLHSLIRRAALLINTIEQRTGKEALDVTSQVLLAGMEKALKHEPAVTDARAWATCLRNGSSVSVLPEVSPRPVEVSVENTPAEVAPQEEPRQRLFTWKLVPQPGRTGIGWTVSPYRGIAIVRAYDPVQARRLVTDKFKLEPAAGDQQSDSPWERRSLVRCELLEDPAYDHILSAAVVYP